MHFLSLYSIPPPPSRTRRVFIIGQAGQNARIGITQVWGTGCSRCSQKALCAGLPWTFHGPTPIRGCTKDVSGHTIVLLVSVRSLRAPLGSIDPVAMESTKISTGVQAVVVMGGARLGYHGIEPESGRHGRLCSRFPANDIGKGVIEVAFQGAASVQGALCRADDAGDRLC